VHHGSLIRNIPIPTKPRRAPTPAADDRVTRPHVAESYCVADCEAQWILAPKDSDRRAPGATAFASVRKPPTGEVSARVPPRTAYGVIARPRPKVLLRCIPTTHESLKRLGRPDKARRELREQLLGAQAIDLDRYVAVNAHQDPHATPWCVLLLHFKPHPIGQSEWTKDRLKAFIGKLGLRRSPATSLTHPCGARDFPMRPIEH